MHRSPDDPDELVGGLAAGLPDEEPVALPREHEELDGLQPGDVLDHAVMQNVLVGVDDEYRRGEGAAVAEAVERHGARRERVGEGVVHGGARRQRQAPHLVEQRRAQGFARRARDLRWRGVLAAEEGPEEDEACEAERREADPLAVARRDVVRGFFLFLTFF